MGDDIGSGCGCFDFRRGAALHCWVYVVYGRKMTLDDNLSLNPNRVKSSQVKLELNSSLRQIIAAYDFNQGK